LQSVGCFFWRHLCFLYLLSAKLNF
jgi:hypothetical protein